MLTRRKPGAGGKPVGPEPKTVARLPSAEGMCQWPIMAALVGSPVGAPVRSLVVALVRSLIGPREQSLEVVTNHPVALARSHLQPRAVEHRKNAAAVADQPGALERAGGDASR